jgi:hypothetical protein
MTYIPAFAFLDAEIDGVLVCEEEVADMLCVDLETLARWRKEVQGPNWYQFEDVIRYDTYHVERFIERSVGGRNPDMPAFNPLNVFTIVHKTEVDDGKESRGDSA